MPNPFSIVLSQMDEMKDGTMKFVQIYIIPDKDSTMFERLLKEFPCQGCGYCCTKLNGVSLMKHEAIYLDKKRRGVCKLATLTDKDDPRFKYKLEQPCTFHDGKGCEVYQHRPKMCELFPFRIFPDKIMKEHFPEYDQVRPHGTIVLMAVKECQGARLFLKNMADAVDKIEAMG